MSELEGKTGLLPAPSTKSSPRFACVQPDSTRKYANLNLGYDLWERCQTGTYPGPTSTEERIRSFYAEETAYIFLCPLFFDLPSAPDKTECPDVVDNGFVGDGGAIVQYYKTYRIIYELYRFYTGDEALGPQSFQMEVFDWNRSVLGLDALGSALNPLNMGLYVFSKSPR